MLWGFFHSLSLYSTEFIYKQEYNQVLFHTMLLYTKDIKVLLSIASMSSIYKELFLRYK